MAVAASDADPLFHGLGFAFQEVFYPLGFPVLVCSNDPRILTAARESFGAFQPAFSSETLRLDVAVIGGGGGGGSRGPLRRSPAHLLSFFFPFRLFRPVAFCS